MKKHYLFLTLFIAIILTGCVNLQNNDMDDKIINNVKNADDQISLNSKTCDELLVLSKNEFDKLNFSCDSDNDCTTGAGQCSCKKAGVNTDKFSEIYEIEVKKNCIPRIECAPYECKCTDNKCAYKVLPRDEWGW